MRIRTVKPEFWQSVSLASIAKEHRLLAIALLNYADDDGYFEAIPQVIRGALMPFDEDSKSVLRGLQELSRIDFIQLAEHSGKPIGRIPNFRAHQRIDKPQKSRLSALKVDWDAGNAVSQDTPGTFQEPSKNDPGTFQEPSKSILGGNGMEEEQGRGKEKEPTTPSDVDIFARAFEPPQRPQPRNDAPPHKPKRKNDHRAFTVGVDFKVQPSLSFFIQECNRAISPSWQEWALRRHYEALDGRGWRDAQGQSIGHWGLYMASVYDAVDDHWEFVDRLPIGSIAKGVTQCGQSSAS